MTKLNRAAVSKGRWQMSKDYVRKHYPWHIWTLDSRSEKVRPEDTSQELNDPKWHSEDGYQEEGRNEDIEYMLEIRLRCGYPNEEASEGVCN